jgi:purine-binding chemotaxis protein CheW
MRSDAYDSETDARDCDDNAARTFLTFDLGGQTFGVSVRNVREILDRLPITRLPGAAHDMEGVIDVRGASVPVLDLSQGLRLDPAGDGPDARMIVFERAGGDAVAVRTDRVREVCRIDRSAVEKPPRGDAHSGGDAVSGLFRRDGALVVLLAAERLFGAEAPSGF